MQFRPCTIADAAILARMNQELIRDERHRNRMTIVELEQRMVAFLNGGYEAVMFEQEETDSALAVAIQARPVRLRNTLCH